MEETSLPIPTPGGRLLTAAAYGPHDGSPVLSLHGTPGSRLQSPPDVSLLERTGIRMITYDRPGYGASTRQPGRHVKDAAADVETVADAFAVQHFAVLGFSGGGPHALAVAALLPERVTRCAAMASVAPMDATGLDFFAGMSAGNLEEFDAALAGRDALAIALDPVAGAVAEDVYAFIRALGADLPHVDAAVLDRPDVTQLFADSVSEGLRPGAGGWVDDDLAFAAGWGFDVGQIRVPVGVWHGTEDTLVPVAHAGWLAQAIPGAEGHIVVGVGHYGMLDQLGEVLIWLAG
jgi:pimeloyl-ACP methyl ester carboxylesterase